MFSAIPGDRISATEQPACPVSTRSTPATWIPLALARRRTSLPMKLPQPETKIFMPLLSQSISRSLNGSNLLRVRGVIDLGANVGHHRGKRHRTAALQNLTD